MKIIAKSALAALSIALLATSGGIHAQTQLNLGGSSTTSPFFAYYASVAETITKRAGLNVTVISAGGYDINMQQLRLGKMQLAGMSPDLINDAETDPRRPFKDIRVLWWATSAPQYIVVRADSGVNTLADLKDKCFHPGMTGSGSEKSMMKILGTLKIVPKLHLSDPRDAINAIQNGRCLGQVRTGTTGRLDPATEELNLNVPLKIIGLTPAEVESVRRTVPWMPLVKQPANVIKGSPELVTHEIPVGVVTTKAMDNDTAYKIVKAMWEGIDAQRASFRQIQGVDVPKKTLETNGGVLHAGAVRYYREIGLTVPANLLPPESN
jgi:TRAP transporter TAXI family solute receptor